MRLDYRIGFDYVVDHRPQGARFDGVREAVQRCPVRVDEDAVEPNVSIYHVVEIAA